MRKAHSRSRNPSPESLEDFAGTLKGGCHVRAEPTRTASPLTCQGQHVSFCWIAVCALETFRLAEFIELDCSSKAIKLYECCIRLVLWRSGPGAGSAENGSF
jgi:hypothetical protein